MVVCLGIRGDRRDDVAVRRGAERDLRISRPGIIDPRSRVDRRRLLWRLRALVSARDPLRRSAERDRFHVVEHGRFDGRVLDQSRSRQRQEEQTEDQPTR